MSCPNWICYHIDEEENKWEKIEKQKIVTTIMAIIVSSILMSYLCDGNWAERHKGKKKS